ncbi:MAG: SPASM domain-containing protein [Elusimicrobia bacterium]|nr:SPASM domain-containing protein [Elusimicrobiota bacterium]
MFKPSKYNFLIETSDNHLLLYNSRTSAFAAVPLEFSGDIQYLLTNPSRGTEKDEEIIKNLETGGFLIKPDIDELRKIRKVYDDYKNDGKKVILTMLASEACNFNCPYCFTYDKRGLNMTPWVYDAALKYLQKSINKDSQIKINWFGGEPTLAHDNIISFSNRLNQLTSERKLKKPIYTMVTNGYLMTVDKFESYVEAGIKNFQITLDGPESFHNKTRSLSNGRETFQTIWNNLVTIKSVKPNFEMSIRVNFLANMRQEIYDLTNKFASVFGADERFGIYFRPVYNFETNRQDICAMKDSICSMAEGLQMQLEYDLHAMEVLSKYRKKSAMPNPIPRAIPAWCETEKQSSWIIGADGLLFKCDTYVGRKEQAAGKINMDGEIERFQGAYKWDTDIYTAKIENCIKCKLLPLCQGGCPRLRMEGKKSCHLNEPYLKEILLKAHATHMNPQLNVAYN